MYMVEGKVATLLSRVEEIERMVVGQFQFFSRLGSGSTAERQCARLLSTLRQKILLLIQKPVPNFKPRQSDTEQDTYYEESSTGIIHAVVDCTLEEYENLARIVHSRSGSALFRPSFQETQSLAACIELAEIIFPSCNDLCTVIGINSVADMRNILRRRKGGGKEGTMHEAIRIVGLYIADETDENSAAAMLVGTCMPYARRKATVDALVRKSREFDFRSMSYTHPLSRASLQAVDLVSNVFSARLSATPSQVSKEEAVKNVFSQLKTFSMRWRPMVRPNSRFWSTASSISENVCGSLEVELPYFIIRGFQAVSEIGCSVTDEYLTHVFCTKGQPHMNTSSCMSS